jgi:hypothetical protein
MQEKLEKTCFFPSHKVRVIQDPTVYHSHFIVDLFLLKYQETQNSENVTFWAVGEVGSKVA